MKVITILLIQIGDLKKKLEAHLQQFKMYNSWNDSFKV